MCPYPSRADLREFGPAQGTTPPYDPAQIPQSARVILGYLSESSPGFHLDLGRQSRNFELDQNEWLTPVDLNPPENPLAEVNLYQAPFTAQVTLPTGIPTRSTYLLILGSSGNTSPLFTIEGTGPPTDDISSAVGSTTRGLEAKPMTYVIGGSTVVMGNGAPTINLPGSLPSSTPVDSDLASPVESSPAAVASPSTTPSQALVASPPSPTVAETSSTLSAGLAEQQASAAPTVTSAAQQVVFAKMTLAAIIGCVGTALLL